MNSRLRRQDGVTLIELLVSIIIAGVLSTMLIGTWLTLNRSFRSSTISAEQRDHAQQAISLMEREIRDAEALTAMPILKATSSQLLMTTTFNNAGNETNVNQPRRVQYQLAQDPDDPAGLPASKQNWQLVRTKDRLGSLPGFSDDAPQVLVEHVVNSVAEPVFYYTYYDADGVWRRDSNVSSANLMALLTVEVHLKVDQNPGHSPEYLLITTTIQPRNLRGT
jgi:prepilin-type N-terminal cleavage/methylation domain-containing protein